MLGRRHLGGRVGRKPGVDLMLRFLQSVSLVGAVNICIQGTSATVAVTGFDTQHALLGS